MVFSAHPNGSIEFVNRRWLDFTGHNAGEVLDDAWRNIVHPDDLTRTAEAWQRGMASGQDVNMELRLRTADGSYSWILSRSTALRDRDGHIVRWYGIVLDIDSQKRLLETLRKRESMLADSERRFRVLAEAIPVICWTADATGWIDWYSHRWYEFTGQLPEEAAGWGWQAAHHPNDFLEVMKQWPHSISTGESFEMEYRLRRHDGVLHWFLTRAEPLRDEQNRIIRWYGSNIDIDAQKQALEQTTRIAETLQDVFLPKQFPQRPGLRLDAVYLAAEKNALVGGDWYDAFELPDGRLMFSIGDVAGHGLHASTIVGRLRQTIYTLTSQIDDPALILRETDRILRSQDPGTMVTALVGWIDQSHSRMRFASAGHPPPMVAYRSDEPATVLPYGGPPLGTGFDLEFEAHSVALEPDAVIALYTDGMTEFSGDIIETENKLRTAVALLVGNTAVAHPAMAVQEIIFDDMPLKDDAVLFVLQFSSVDPAQVLWNPMALERTWRFHSSDAYTAHTSRQEIGDYLCEMAADAADVFNCELIVGEILANTVEHAPGLVEVYSDWTGEKPVLCISDTGPGVRDLNTALPANEFDEDGRGLFLVRALADEVSLKPSPGYGAKLRVVLPIKRKNYERDQPLLRDKAAAPAK
jgi:PAS domain S-box-containing protein